ncbi:Ig-like domain-containing protein, partial [Kineosporia sp. A_224]|uniref:Ig-like domain-containing protein n=1 Tax=Kineosporia sp. A_224 TaxID=1962180 RepID=UPI00117BA4F9
MTSTDGLAVRVTTAAAPPPGAPRLAPASDSGVSPVDGITNVTTPTLTGDLAPGLGGAAVAVFDGPTQVAATTAASDGSWVAALGRPLGAGVHALSARAALNGGARGSASPATTVVVDVVPPAAPTVASASCGRGQAVLTGGSWTCTASTLGDDGLRYSFTASDTTSGIASVVYTAATSTVAMPAAVPLPGAGVVLPFAAGVATTPAITSVEAYATVAVAAVDLAGNRSATQTLPAVVDTTAPEPGAAVTGCSVALVAGVCPGATTVTVTGIADGEVTSGVSLVEWSVAGGPSGVAGVSSGTARFSFSAPDGRPAVTFTVRDVAGNAAVPGHVTPEVPQDGSGPTVSSVVLTDGGSPGAVGPGDSLAVTLADGVSGVDPNSLFSGWTSGTTQGLSSADGAVVVTVTDAGADDVLTVAVAGAVTNVGSFALGGDYVEGDAVTFSGNGSGASALRWVGRDANTLGTLTVSLGALASGSPRVAAGAPVAVWT